MQAFKRYSYACCLDKLVKAAQQTGTRIIALAGGVAANTYLRQQLQILAQQYNWTIFVPAVTYCTDNAAMIAMTAHYKYHCKDFSPYTIPTLARMVL